MFLITFTIIQLVITMQFMILIAGWVNNISVMSVKYKAYRIINNRTVAFCINMLISCVIAWFTGDGMSSGFSNLLASILAAVISPYVLEWKYKFSKLETEYEAHLKKRKEQNPFARIRRKLRPGKQAA